MTTTALLFRKHNFLLLDKILNEGDFVIEGNGFIDPYDEVFKNPITNQQSNNGNRIKKRSKHQDFQDPTKEHERTSQGSCSH